MPVIVTCSACGSLVPADDRFCGSCGATATASGVIGAVPYDPWTDLLQRLRQATVGEYEIVGELGRGGMAAVFLAHDLHLNRKVAVKVMLPGLLFGENMWDRFLAEARTAAKLDHPNIVYIHSVKEKGHFLYFVMKYIDGLALDDLLEQHRPIPVPVAQTVLVEVTRALDYAHCEGVVHRDVKPANIMIDQRGSAIVMDFGIARAADTRHFTQSGATVGTPAYMCPELCHGNETTTSSDQYSLGVLAYEMLAGAPPFRGTPIELQVSHMQDTPAPLGDLRADVPVELSDAVMRMLEKDPRERWPSLQHLVPIFARGLDALDEAPRNQLISLVRSGSPRRTPRAATPISPAPLRPSRPTPLKSIMQVTSYDAHPSAPTKPVSEAELAEVEGERGRRSAAAARKGSRRAMSVAGSAVVLLAAAGVLGLRGTKAPQSQSSAARGDSVPMAPSAADAVEAALGDSVVIGHGADATARVAGRSPRVVSTDAVALIQVSLARPRVVEGDTVHAKIEAFDDAGRRVTSPEMVESTSNPRVVRFAGPGELVGVSAGTATITVSSGATTTAREVIVAARPERPIARNVSLKKGA